MDLRNTKVMVSSREESAQVQTRLFELGFRWRSGATSPRYCSKRVLILDDDKFLDYSTISKFYRIGLKAIGVIDIMSTFPEEYIIVAGSEDKAKDAIALAYGEKRRYDYHTPSNMVLVNNKISNFGDGNRLHAGHGYKYAKNKDCPVYTYNSWAEWFCKDGGLGGILGYKLKSDCGLYKSAVESILGNKCLSFSFLVDSVQYRKLKSANVLDLWFEPQYKPKYKLPVINGYQGKDVDDEIRFGCQSFSYEYVICAYELFVEMNITSAILKVESTTITADDLKAIVDYIENK